MNRTDMLGRLRTRQGAWDLVVIGGGATGLGIAVDAAARGYEVALLEQGDFGHGTSSRSTKLVHGGVRYLRQGNVSLVREALRERGILRRNAPHLVSELRFLVPNYAWWEPPYYGVGLKLYDLLAGGCGFAPSRWLGRERTLCQLPTLRAGGLRGGVEYSDGQFDDARLIVCLARTAADQGATLVNYVKITRLVKRGDGSLRGVVALDMETAVEWEIEAKVVVNATGPFADGVLRLDDPQATRALALSQGVHLVVERAFLPTDCALMAPRTRDGRVLFAIPWHGRTLIGTTDTPVEDARLEPTPTSEELEFLLDTAAEYLDPAPRRQDVLSVFTGIRPLGRVRMNRATAALSRDHTLRLSPSGLLTISGGKWTTYRSMAQATVDRAAAVAGLRVRPCRTERLPLHGAESGDGADGPLAVYGADASALRALTSEDPALAEFLDAALPYTRAEVVWACQREMARTVDDVLSRRTRALVLNARAARAAAPRVAEWMARELGRDAAWQREQVLAFERIAQAWTIDS